MAGEQINPAAPEAFSTANLRLDFLEGQTEVATSLEFDAGQLARVPEIFDARLNEVTQAHVLDFLSATAADRTHPDGNIKSPQAFTAAATLFAKTMESGNTFDDSMVLTMQFLARLNSAVRKDIDITSTGVTTMTAENLVTTAENDWPQLRDHEIIAIKTGTGQGHFALKRQPTVVVDRDSMIRPEATPQNLRLPPENGYWIAGGSGGDVWTTAYLAKDVFRQEDPVIISSLSPWAKPLPNGKLPTPPRATPIGDSGRVFQADAETIIENTRHMDYLVAARGLRTFIVAFDPRRDRPEAMADDFKRLADHLRIDPSHIALVDTGGDILASSQPGERLGRDQISMQATLRLQEYLGTKISNLFVAAPGVDAPDNMNEIAQAIGVHAYDLAPYAEAFHEQARQDGIMTADPQRYSRMLQSMWYALHPQTLAQKTYLNQPLLLPVEQALKPKKARPAFAAITEQMHFVHRYDLRTAAGVVGIS